jgi:hypothetical protein
MATSLRGTISSTSARHAIERVNYTTAGIVKLISLPGPALVWHTRRMKTPPTSNPYKRHRFPAEIISHWVWLYFRFCLSYRDVEELMAGFCRKFCSEGV